MRSREFKTECNKRPVEEMLYKIQMIVAHYVTFVDSAFPSLFNSTFTLRKYSFLVSTYSRGAIGGVYLSSDLEWKVFVQNHLSENRHKVMKKKPS